MHAELRRGPQIYEPDFLVFRSLRRIARVLCRGPRRDRCGHPLHPELFAHQPLRRSLRRNAFRRKELCLVARKGQRPSTPLPYPLQLASQTACTSLPLGATANCGVIQGVWPVANTSGGYSVWTANGYTVLDLTQLNGFQSLCPGSGQSCLPLYLTVRNTLPGSGFPCSGAAVPFNTAEYTNEDGDGGGLMGPPCTPPRRSQCRPGRWCRTGYLRNPALLRRRGWRHRSRPRNCAAPSRRTYSA